MTLCIRPRLVSNCKETLCDDLVRGAQWVGSPQVGLPAQPSQSESECKPSPTAASSSRSEPANLPSAQLPSTALEALEADAEPKSRFKGVWWHGPSCKWRAEFSPWRPGSMCGGCGLLAVVDDR
eukprot:5177825-Pyramimonas_sp.AAC.1